MNPAWHSPDTLREATPRPRAVVVAALLSLLVHLAMLAAWSAWVPGTIESVRSEVRIGLRLLPPTQPAAVENPDAAPTLPDPRHEPARPAVASVPEAAKDSPTAAASTRVPSHTATAPTVTEPASLAPPRAQTSLAAVGSRPPAADRGRVELPDRTVLWRLLDRLEQFKSYPRAARRAGLEGTARVWLSIDRDGSLRDQRLEESSGHHILDQAALSLVRRAAPFAPPPGQISDAVEVVLPVTYRLDRGS